MFRTTTVRLAAALAATTLLAAACSSGDGNGGAEPGDSSGRTTIEVAISETPTDLIPHGSQEIGDFLEAFTLPLLQQDDQNNVFSNLLESWETSADGQTVTMVLKPDIQWSDGEPVTSADVVMSFTQYLDPSISVWAPRIGGVVGEDEFADGTAETISGLAAPDERTVTIQLKQPDSAWLSLLGYLAKYLPVLPEHVLGDVPHDQLLAHEFFKTWPVSSGPYMLTEFAADQHLAFEPNPNWSGDEVGFERIFFKVVEKDVQSAQLETGEVQLIQAVAPADVERIGTIEGVEIQSVTGAAPDSWWLMGYEPFLDPRVRQAVAYAIDRQGICEQVLQGYCTVPETNIRQLAPEWAIPTEDVITYDYNPDRARELLAEAGWDPSTELTFYNPTPGGFRSTVVEIAQANLAEVGINWTIVDTDIATWFEAIEKGGSEMQGFLAGGGNFVVDPSQVQVYIDCEAFYPIGSNLAHYCDPETAALFEEGRRTADQEERAEIYQEAFRRMNQNPMDIVLYVQDQILAHDARLKGVKVQPSGGTFWNIAEWHWEE